MIINQINNFIFNYCYEIAGKGIASYSSGTHEICLGYRFDKKKAKSKLDLIQPIPEAAEATPAIQVPAQGITKPEIKQEPLPQAAP